MHDLPPSSTWQMFDIIAAQVTGEVRSDARGTATLTAPLHLVKLLALVPAAVDVDSFASELERYRTLWIE
jgi:hypothetical protein